jgi:hypothetical protein
MHQVTYPTRKRRDVRGLRSCPRGSESGALNLNKEVCNHLVTPQPKFWLHKSEDTVRQNIKLAGRFTDIIQCHEVLLNFMYDSIKLKYIYISLRKQVGSTSEVYDLHSRNARLKSRSEHILY